MPDLRSPEAATPRQGVRARPLKNLIIVRNGSFGLLWSSQLLSSIGTCLLVVAVPFYVFQLTGSARDTGLASVAEIVPMIFAGPFAGVFVDRWNRRSIMIGSDLLRAVSVCLLIFFDRPGQIWILLAAVFLENAIGAFFSPAYTAVMPMTVGRDTDLEIANAWTSVAIGITQLAGSPLGGALYEVLGFKPLVAIDAATYLVSAGLVALMPVLRKTRRSATTGAAGTTGTTGTTGAKAASGGTLSAFARRFCADLRAGIAGLLDDRVLTTVLAAGALFMLGNAAADALLVPYIVTDLGAKATDVGLLLSALGAGYLVSAYVGRKVCASPYLRRNVAALLASVALAFTGFFNIHVFAVALVCVGLAGIPGGAFLMLKQTLLQRRAPDELIGRISSAYTTAAMVATLIGAALSSLLVESIGITIILNSSIIVVAAGSLLALLLPRTITRELPQPARVQADGLPTTGRS